MDTPKIEDDGILQLQLLRPVYPLVNHKPQEQTVLPQGNANKAPEDPKGKELNPRT